MDRENDPRIHDEFGNEIYVRSTEGTLIPVATDGAVYIFNGNILHHFKATMTESFDDCPRITTQTNINDLVAAYRRREK